MPKETVNNLSVLCGQFATSFLYRDRVTDMSPTSRHSKATLFAAAMKSSSHRTKINKIFQQQLRQRLSFPQLRSRTAKSSGLTRKRTTSDAMLQRFTLYSLPHGKHGGLIFWKRRGPTQSLPVGLAPLNFGLPWCWSGTRDLPERHHNHRLGSRGATRFGRPIRRCRKPGMHIKLEELLLALEQPRRGTHKYCQAQSCGSHRASRVQEGHVGRGSCIWSFDITPGKPRLQIRTHGSREERVPHGRKDRRQGWMARSRKCGMPAR
ncbi:hypothetical protein CCUS01_16801 [Colletotrichum cuscutae]|uniref:Uncharacterized protein n=1 Tax=Colletotrichum cuscutae TaxID=1209917 RepID=A0AAI9VAP9_9PEZI|nr:hypothetical protein CCUS01_16801 [Colletotrichum cuscutae]